MLRKPRRPRKKKAEVQTTTTAFQDALDDAFGCGEEYGQPDFAAMFGTLEDRVKGLGSAVANYQNELYERVMLGDMGVLSGERDEEAPVDYSMLGVEERDLEPFCAAYEKFSQRFPVLRNYSDYLFCRLLTSLKQFPEPLQGRVLRIIATLIRLNVYTRSKKDEFFLKPVTKEPDGCRTLTRFLDALREAVGDAAAYAFATQENFLQSVEHEDFDTDQFKRDLPWFAALMAADEGRAQLASTRRQFQDAFRTGKATVTRDVVLEPLGDEARAKYAAPEQWVTFLVEVALGALDPSRLGTERCIALFRQLEAPLRESVTTVAMQGLLVDVLQRACFEPGLTDLFKPLLLHLYEQQIVDGNVIIAWYERAIGRGKATFGQQMTRFVQWLKSDE